MSDHLAADLRERLPDQLVSGWPDGTERRLFVGLFPFRMSAMAAQIRRFGAARVVARAVRRVVTGRGGSACCARYRLFLLDG